MIVVVMGVAGAGKTTIGKRLAQELGWPFFEGDDYHPPANIAKMERGEPLTDDDRRPWLDALRALIGALDRAGESAVIACSDLKKEYRRRLRGETGAKVRFIFLKPDPETLRRRLVSRGERSSSCRWPLSPAGTAERWSRNRSSGTTTSSCARLDSRSEPSAERRATLGDSRKRETRRLQFNRLGTSSPSSRAVLPSTS